ISSLVQHEDVGETEEKEGRRQPVAEADGDAGSQDAENKEVDVHATTRPRFDPTESVVSEVDGRFDVIPADPVMSEIAVDLPKHYRAENDPEEDQERNV